VNTWRLISIALRQKRVAILSYCVAGLALIALYVAIYPSLAKQIDSYNEIIKTIPPALMKVFGASQTATNFERLAGVKQYGFTWPLIMLFLVVSLAGSSLAGEIERGTLGLWLSAPVSRVRVYWAKYAAAVLALVAFVAASILVVIPMTAAANITVNNTHFLELAAIGLGFGLAVLSFAFMLSASFSDKGSVYAITTAVLLVMYVANIVASLVSSLDGLKYLSFFYYYNAADLLSGLAFNPWSLVVFGATTLICAILGALIFNRRDISI
jgi:ABC-2 type transport system permease protein